METHNPSWEPRTGEKRIKDSKLDHLIITENGNKNSNEAQCLTVDATTRAVTIRLDKPAVRRPAPHVLPVAVHRDADPAIHVVIRIG